MKNSICIPKSLRDLSSRLASPMPLYLVGGGVRNALLGFPDSDYDLTGALDASTFCALAQKAGYKALIRSSRMGTVEIRLEDQILEYTTFRIESYAPGGGHHPEQVVFTTSLEEDAKRRDFTANALYADLATGQISDPLQGRKAIAAKQLRACRPNATDTLKDDGLRLLRMARFAGELGFSIEPALMQAARQYAEQIHAISKPRVWNELKKIVLADVPYHTTGGHIIAMEALEQSGVLFALIPELKEGDGLLQSERYHAYDVLHHNLACYAASESDLVLRWAALLHDVGKPKAKRETGRMIRHDIIGAALCPGIFFRLGADNDTIQGVQLLVARHMFDLEGTARVNTVRKRFALWGFEFAENLIAMRRYDVAGSGRPMGPVDTAGRWEGILRQMKQEGCIDQINQLKISGQEIMQVCGLAPSPMIGKIKQALFEYCAIYPAYNENAKLRDMAPKLYRQFLN